MSQNCESPTENPVILQNISELLASLWEWIQFFQLVCKEKHGAAPYLLHCLSWLHTWLGWCHACTCQYIKIQLETFSHALRNLRKKKYLLSLHSSPPLFCIHAKPWFLFVSVVVVLLCFFLLQLGNWRYNFTTCMFGLNKEFYFLK